MKKLLALLLACLMLISVLASCQTGTGGVGDGTDDGTTTTESNTETTDEITSEEETELNFYHSNHGRLYANIDFDFNTESGPTDFHVISWDDERVKIDLGDYETPADALQLNLVERNKQVEEELGIRFQYDYYACSDAEAELFRQVENDCKGAGKYELILSCAKYSSTPMIRDYLVNLLDEKQVPYLELDMYYHTWNQNFIDDLQSNNQLYHLIGSSNLLAYNNVVLTYINLDLYDELVTDEEEWLDLYEVAFDGDWTFELLFQYASIYKDINENTEKDTGDVYGLVSNPTGVAYDSFLHAFDLNLTKTNDDGTHAWMIESDKRIEDAMAKVTDLYKQNGVWMLDDASIAEGGYTQQYQMFATNKAIFYIDALIHSEEQATAFWNMRYKYGVLPLPKYDGEQKDYISYLQGDYACYSIPNHSNFNKYTSSATLEYLNFCSYKYTTIYYEEKIIKSQYLATKENAQVLDFVTERVNFDFAEQHGQMLNNAKDLLWTSVAKNGGTVSDVWTEQKETLTDALKQLDLWFMSKK